MVIYRKLLVIYKSEKQQLAVAYLWVSVMSEVRGERADWFKMMGSQQYS